MHLRSKDCRFGRKGWVLKLSLLPGKWQLQKQRRGGQTQQDGSGGFWSHCCWNSTGLRMKRFREQWLWVGLHTEGWRRWSSSKRESCLALDAHGSLAVGIPILAAVLASISFAFLCPETFRTGWLVDDPTLGAALFFLVFWDPWGENRKRHATYGQRALIGHVLLGALGSTANGKVKGEQLGRVIPWLEKNTTRNYHRGMISQRWWPWHRHVWPWAHAPNLFRGGFTEQIHKGLRGPVHGAGFSVQNTSHGLFGLKPAVQERPQLAITYQEQGVNYSWAIL